MCICQSIFVLQSCQRSRPDVCMLTPNRINVRSIRQHTHCKDCATSTPTHGAALKTTHRADLCYKSERAGKGSVQNLKQAASSRGSHQRKQSVNSTHYHFHRTAKIKFMTFSGGRGQITAQSKLENSAHCHFHEILIRQPIILFQ